MPAADGCQEIVGYVAFEQTLAVLGEHRCIPYRLFFVPVLLFRLRENSSLGERALVSAVASSESLNFQ